MPVSFNKQLNHVVPTRLMLKYIYQGDIITYEYESFDPNELLDVADCIESRGGTILEFCFETSLIHDDCGYSDWDGFALLVKRMYDLHVITCSTFNAIATFIPEEYRHIMSNEQISN